MADALTPVMINSSSVNPATCIAYCVLAGGSSAKSLKSKKKNACLRSKFPAYLASMRRTLHFALATTSLLVISAAAAHAQALAPSTLHLTSPERETKKDIVQVFTKDSAQAVTKERSPEQKTKKDIVRATTKEPLPVIAKKPSQVITKEPVRAFAIGPVRPIAIPYSSETTQSVTHYSYKTPQ